MKEVSARSKLIQGCKAENSLLSWSTHYDLRWRDDRRRGPDVNFSELATNRGERHRIINTASYLYTNVELLGRNLCTRCFCEVKELIQPTMLPVFASLNAHHPDLIWCRRVASPFCLFSDCSVVAFSPLANNTGSSVQLFSCFTSCLPRR